MAAKCTLHNEFLIVEQNRFLPTMPLLRLPGTLLCGLKHSHQHIGPLTLQQTRLSNLLRDEFPDDRHVFEGITTFQENIRNVAWFMRHERKLDTLLDPMITRTKRYTGAIVPFYYENLPRDPGPTLPNCGEACTCTQRYADSNTQPSPRLVVEASRYIKTAWGDEERLVTYLARLVFDRKSFRRELSWRPQLQGIITDPFLWSCFSKPLFYLGPVTFVDPAQDHRVARRAKQ